MSHRISIPLVDVDSIPLDIVYSSSDEDGTDDDSDEGEDSSDGEPQQEAYVTPAMVEMVKRSREQRKITAAPPQQKKMRHD
jgi:hypothetical protein